MQSNGGMRDSSQQVDTTVKVTSSTGADDDDNNFCDTNRNTDNVSSNLISTEVKDFVPADGGMQAWLVMMSSFICNGIIFGTINSFGVIFVYLKETYQYDNDAATKASLVGSVGVGATFLLSPISGILADQYGFRKVSFFGGFIATLGMFLSSFFIHQIEILCLTYGVMFGGGSSLVYTPSLVILGHYFRRHIGVVNGFVTMGSSIFTLVMPHILEHLLSTYTVAHCFLVMSSLTASLMLASINFKTRLPLSKDLYRVRGGRKKKSFCSKLVNVKNWKNPRYVIWALATPSALFGYFIPYVHIVQYVKDILPGRNGGTLVTCIALTSGFGRLIFGKIADLPWVNRIMLQQISFISIGICTMLLTAAPFFHGFQYEALIILALILGIFDGCFITMFGPIAFDICGPIGASQAIGFILGMCSLPLTVGPPIAGILYDHLGNYTVAFLCAGIPPIVGALLMSLIYCTNPVEKSSCQSVEPPLSQDQESSPLQEDLIIVESPHLHASETVVTIVPNFPDDNKSKN